MSMSSRIFARSPQAIFTEVGDDVVALHVDRGFCYGMENVSRAVWKLLEQPSDLDTLCARLIEQFEVDPDICKKEVALLLQQMRDEGLLEEMKPR